MVFCKCVLWLSYCATITWLVSLPTVFVFVTSVTRTPMKYEMLGMVRGEGIQEWFTSLLQPSSSVKHLWIYDFMLEDLWGGGVWTLTTEAASHCVNLIKSQLHSWSMFFIPTYSQRTQALTLKYGHCKRLPDLWDNGLTKAFQCFLIMWYYDPSAQPNRISSQTVAAISGSINQTTRVTHISEIIQGLGSVISTQPISVLLLCYRHEASDSSEQPTMLF